MLEYPRWKYLLVAVVLVLALVFALPNVFGEDPALQVERKDHTAINADAMRALGLRPMPLGLDLRGGLYLLYQVDVNAAVSQALDGYAADARRALAAAHIPVKEVTTVAASAGAPGGVRVVLPPEADVNAARGALGSTLQGLTISTESLPSGSAITAVMTAAQIRERR